MLSQIQLGLNHLSTKLIAILNFEYGMEELSMAMSVKRYIFVILVILSFFIMQIDPLFVSIKSRILSLNRDIKSNFLGVLKAT